MHSSVIFDFTIGVPNAPSVIHHGAAEPMKRKNKITTIEVNPKSGDSTGSSSGWIFSSLRHMRARIREKDSESFDTTISIASHCDSSNSGSGVGSPASRGDFLYWAIMYRAIAQLCVCANAMSAVRPAMIITVAKFPRVNFELFHCPSSYLFHTPLST